MEPIVSPWFIYAIGIADNVSAAMAWMGFFISIACIIAFGVIVSLTDEKDPKMHVKPRWLFLPPMIMLMWWTVFALIPDSKTLIGMAVAKNVTHDRAIKAGHVIYAAKDDLKKDIVDIIAAINKTKQPAPSAPAAR